MNLFPAPSKVGRCQRFIIPGSYRLVDFAPMDFFMDDLPCLQVNAFPTISLGWQEVLSKQCRQRCLCRKMLCGNSPKKPLRCELACKFGDQYRKVFISIKSKNAKVTLVINELEMSLICFEQNNRFLNLHLSDLSPHLSDLNLRLSELKL